MADAISPGVALNIPNGHDGNYITEPKFMPYCNGRPGLSGAIQDPGTKYVTSMEEVTCKLKGIRVSIACMVLPV